jgi:hypothetical protein
MIVFYVSDKNIVTRANGISVGQGTRNVGMDIPSAERPLVWGVRRLKQLENVTPFH